MKRLPWTVLAALVLLLAGCNGGGGGGSSLTVDFAPFEAAAADGTEAELTARLPLGFSGPLYLEASYRLPGGDWGAWQRVASFAIAGNTARAAFEPAWPVGLDELGKEARLRVTDGARALAVSDPVRLRRVLPLWTARIAEMEEPFFAFGAGEGLVCYGGGGELACHRAEDGRLDFTLTVGDLDPRLTLSVEGVLPYRGRLYLTYNDQPTTGWLSIYELRSLQRIANVPLDFRPSGAIAASGERLFVGGGRFVALEDRPKKPEEGYDCTRSKYQNVEHFRLTLASFDLEGNPLFTYQAGPGDVYESAYVCHGNTSSALAIHPIGDALLVPFAYRTMYHREEDVHLGCLGFLRLSAENLSGAAYLHSPDNVCSDPRVRGSGRFSPLAGSFYYFGPANDQGFYVEFVNNPAESDADPTRGYLYTTRTKGMWVRADTLSTYDPGLALDEHYADPFLYWFFTGSGDYALAYLRREEDEGFSYAGVVRLGDVPPLDPTSPSGYDFLRLEGTCYGFTRTAKDEAGRIFLLYACAEGDRRVFHLMRLR